MHSACLIFIFVLCTCADKHDLTLKRFDQTILFRTPLIGKHLKVYLLNIIPVLNFPNSMLRELSSASVYFQKHIPKQNLMESSDSDPSIWGMIYNSAFDELFFADCQNGVVRALLLYQNASGLRDVYKVKGGNLNSVCHMCDSDTLLVCLHEQNSHWLVALKRNGILFRLLTNPPLIWSDTDRVQTGGEGGICCALSESRVLIGAFDSMYMELFRVYMSGDFYRIPRVQQLNRIPIHENYTSFCVTTSSDSDTLVAMSYESKNEVRVNRLRDDRLDELARIRLQTPGPLVWLGDRLIATEWHANTSSNSITELEVSGTRIERRRQLFAPDDKIVVWRWCAVDGGFAIVESNSQSIMHFLVRS